MGNPAAQLFLTKFVQGPVLPIVAYRTLDEIDKRTTDTVVSFFLEADAIHLAEVLDCEGVIAHLDYVHEYSFHASEIESPGKEQQDRHDQAGCDIQPFKRCS